MDVFRHTFWAIPPGLQIVLYAASAVSLILFGYGFYRRYRMWKKGRPSPLSLAQVKSVLLSRLAVIISQRRIREEERSGRMHMLLSAGMVVLFIGTVLVFFDYDFQLHFLRGWFYLLYEAVLDLFGVLFLIGVGLAVVDRLPGRRIARLLSKPADYAMLGLLFAIGISGFVLEALRLAITLPAHGGWSFVGYALGQGLLLMGVNESSIPVYLAAWVIHMLLSLAFIALIPYTKLIHIFLAPINILLTEPLTETDITPAFNLSRQSLEEAAAAGRGLGGSRPRDFTFAQLLSVDACTECGRCDEVCPAAQSGKPLAPRSIVLKLRDQMHRPDEPLAGFSQEELLSCTTCGACMERCPVSIRHVPMIVSLRQGLIGENLLEPQMAETLANLQTYHNPWGHPGHTRTEWTKGLQVKVAENREEAM
ncbi:4Fe-4S dicluster domain-containing protein [Brevibacillus sp. B_LB10_24]|uniref:4Fe-4S dicluster domain-containing protein n=1 Tax=Brevibacillus sp. B_LB10_24 TaxID=3380645 RepID=UPI0038BBB72D